MLTLYIGLVKVATGRATSSKSNQIKKKTKKNRYQWMIAILEFGHQPHRDVKFPFAKALSLIIWICDNLYRTVDVVVALDSDAVVVLASWRIAVDIQRPAS